MNPFNVPESRSLSLHIRANTDFFIRTNIQVPLFVRIHTFLYSYEYICQYKIRYSWKCYKSLDPPPVSCKKYLLKNFIDVMVPCTHSRLFTWTSKRMYTTKVAKEQTFVTKDWTIKSFGTKFPSFIKMDVRLWRYLNGTAWMVDLGWYILGRKSWKVQLWWYSVNGTTWVVQLEIKKRTMQF